MKKKPAQVLTISSMLLVMSLACNSLPAWKFTPAPTSTPVLTSTQTLPPTTTLTPTALSSHISLASVHSEESGQSPNYTITSETPVILENADPRVLVFNQSAGDIVVQDINEFKATLKYVPGTPVSAGSFLDIGWKLVSPPGEILSLKFETIGYSDGAAHPYHYTQTLTFDIEKGEQVSLDVLFLPDSDYLKFLSDYCKIELAARDIDFDSSSQGADPTVENYRNWNITSDGLMITFDEYQVAPYAAGPQTVIIPYSALQGIIDPVGPLGKFLQ